jgi:hypothetical protein
MARLIPTDTHALATEPFEFQGRTITPQNLYTALFVIGESSRIDGTHYVHGVVLTLYQASRYSGGLPRCPPSSGSSDPRRASSAPTPASWNLESSRAWRTVCSDLMMTLTSPCSEYAGLETV